MTNHPNIARTHAHTRTHAQYRYDIISIGQSVDIDDYTQAAMTVLGDDPSAGGGADLMGQGTWRWNSARSKWAVWSVPMVSEEVQFVTRGASIEGMYDERR